MYADLIDLAGYVRLWLAAFVFTQALEIPVYVGAFRGTGLAGLPVWRRVLIGFGASALTHPAVWYILPFLFHPWVGFGREVYLSVGSLDVTPYVLLAVVAESFAVLAEALYLWMLGVRRAFWWALAANGLSFGLGLVSRELFGWP